MIPMLILSLTLAADPTPKIPIGKETTFVDGPLDKDGYIRYDLALNQRLSNGVTPENNANVLLWQAIGPKPEGTRMRKGYFKALGMAEPPETGNYFITFVSFLKTKKKMSQEKAWNTYETTTSCYNHPWTAKEHPLLAEWLRSIDKPLSLVQQGVAQPRYFNPLIAGPGKLLIGVHLPNIQKSREFAGALSMRAMLHFGEGKLDEAWDDTVACHRLGRHHTHGGTMIEGLVGYAIEAIANSAAIRLMQSKQVTAKQLNIWLTEFEKLPPMQPFHIVFNQGERFMILDAIQMIMRDPSKLSDSDFIPEGFKVENVDWALMFKTYNKLLNQAVQAVTIEPNPKAVDIAAIERKLKSIEPPRKQIAHALQMFMTPKERGVFLGEIYYGLLTPAASKVVSAYVRVMQQSNNENLAFRLAIHNKSTGSYPKQLAELNLPSEPTDLFSGKPLHYSKTADGYKLYSVGQNQTDDHGQSFSDEPRGDDLVVIVPIPEIKD